MKNIFLAPRSNETSYENFSSTILSGRPYSYLEEYLTDSEKKILSKYKKISIWGNKESLRSRWKKMRPGDYVLFYSKGLFNYSARVVLTKYSPKLGLKLWPVDSDGNPWPCLFFIDNVKEVNIPVKVVQEIAGYAEAWDRVQGFMRLNDKGLKNINMKFGSVDLFLSQKPETYKLIEELIENTEDESLEVVEEQAINKDKIFKEASLFKNKKEGYVLDTSTKKVRVENRNQKRRVAQLEDYACQVCNWSLEWVNKKGKKVHRIDIDHIIDKANGGGEELNNLWALCPNCHTKKTLGVIKIDLKKKEVTENGKKVKLHHDNHLGFSKKHRNS